jgi:hypothetical protein
MLHLRASFLLLAVLFFASPAHAQRFSPAEKERLEAEIRRLGSLCKNQLDMKACDRVLEYPTSAEFRRYFGAIRQEAIRRKAELDYQASINRRPQTITQAVSPPPASKSYAGEYLKVLLFFLAVIGIWKWRTLLKWGYDLFVPHPAETYVVPALRADAPVDAKGANHAMAFDPANIEHPPSTYHSQHMAKRADALSERLQADTELAKAIERRERARAAAHRAEQELADLQRRRGSS